MPSRGRPGRIEHAWLGKDDKRLLRWLLRRRFSPGCTFRGGNLSECPTDMNRTGLPAFRRLPGNWPSQRPVQFAHARGVTISPQTALGAGGKDFAKDFQKPTWRQITKNKARGWQISR